MDGFWTIIILIYTAWAIYSGYKILSGRSEWLDRHTPLNIMIKIILSIIVGYFIAAFYLIYLIFKFVFALTKL